MNGAAHNGEEVPQSPLIGLMQDWPLTLDRVLRRMETATASATLSVATESGTERYSFRETALRARQLGAALREYGIGQGERVASIGFNTRQHLELFLGVPASGAVLHTVNPRLTEDHLEYVIGHGGSRLVFVDAMVAGQVIPLLERSPRVEKIVQIETDAYEEFLGCAPSNPGASEPLDERQAAALCYTSGTTGLPKGVLYSHRSNFLHVLGICLADGMGVGSRDTILPIVPLFHANAWGLPHAAGLTGANTVLSGRDTSGEALARLIHAEKVTFSAGVPTVLSALLEAADRNPGVLDSLETAVTGGAPMTKSLFDGFAHHGVNLLQGWGMTETSPNVSLSRPPRETEGTAQAIPYLMSAGRLNAMVDARLVDAEGKELPWDGSSAGEIQLSSPHAASGYFQNPAAAEELMDEGWLRTGDLATIDPSGYVRLKDRMKDLIKSGGEWIPTAELEEVIRSGPGVIDIAVVARPDKRWGERPAAFVVTQTGSSIDVAGLKGYLKSRVPGWWIPDTFEVIDSLPLTSVGKVDKKALRNQVSAI